MAEKKQDMTMAELRDQMAAMLAEAKAQSAALIENARAEAERIVAEAKSGLGSASGMSEEERTAYEAYMNEEVEVKLFRDTIAIQRGERVKIRRKFAEILENSDKQDYATGLLIQRKCAEFAGAEL